MPRCVLIADDSTLARVAVARRVRAFGLDVVERDSAAATSDVDGASLSCALLDLDLGDGRGTDVAERLRTVATALPIAFFSSTREGEVVARAASFGPVFVKPDDLDLALAWILKSAASP